MSMYRLLTIYYFRETMHEQLVVLGETGEPDSAVLLGLFGARAVRERSIPF